MSEHSFSTADYARLYGRMLLIRRFEERLLELFGQGKLAGTTHTYVGQEAVAVSLCDHLRPQDIVFSNHRCHGHFLAREDDPVGLLAEIMGRAGGICGGRGGSQHLCKNNFFSNGIQGGYMPIAVGMALAERDKGSDAVVVAFIGDGTLGEGAVYESLNMAALWQVPLLVVIENNRYAQSTPVERGQAGRLVERPRAFGLSAGEVESNDVHVLWPRFLELVTLVRRERRPHVEIVHTYRFNAHSKGDDERNPDEVAFWRRERDPLAYAAAHLDVATRGAIEAKVQERLRAAEAAAEAMPPARLAPEVV